MAKQMLTKQSEAFGIAFELQDGTDRFGHGGSNEGFTCILMGFADSGSGVAVMTNSDSGYLLIERLAASLAAEYGWKAFKPQQVLVMLTDVDMLARLKGVEAALAAYKARRSDSTAEGTSPNVLNALGYRLLSDGQTADAVKVFEANVALYPEDANAYDSLGEGYLKAGRNADSIVHYKKSLQLDPKNTNAVKMLEKLGAKP
jgi:tetratricopeptide (TPR) repeat protein